MQLCDSCNVCVHVMCACTYVMYVCSAMLRSVMLCDACMHVCVCDVCIACAYVMFVCLSGCVFLVSV